MQKLNSRLNVIVCGLLAGTLLPLPVWGQEAAKADANDLLKVIPADAAAFVATRNLKQLDAEVVAVCQVLQLPVGPAGVFPGPVEYLQQQFGFGEGFRPEGGVGAVLLNCRNAKSSEELENRMVLLIPISDAEKFANSVLAEKEGDLYKMEIQGQMMTAAVKGNFMVAAQQAETVKEFMKAEDKGVASTMSPDRLNAYARDEITVWVNGEAISQDLRQEAIMMINGMMAMAGGGMMPGMNNPSDALKLYLEGTREFTLGFDIDSKKGLLISLYCRPKEDSQLARLMTYKKRPDGSLLMGLPGEPTVAAYGALGTEMTPFAENQLKSSMKALMTMAGDILPEEEQAAILDLIMGFVKNVNVMNLSITNLPPADGAGLVGVASVMTVADSGKCREQVLSIIEKTISTILAAAKKQELPEDELKALEKFLVMNKGAETLAGVKVDHFVADLSQMPDIEDADIEQIEAVLGKEGVLIRMGAVDEKHVLLTFGGGPERFEKIAGLVKEGKAPLTESADIKKVADRLPTDESLVEFYLNLDHAITMVSTIANEVGSPLPFPIQMQNAAPLAISGVPQEGNAMEMHMLIPMELAVSVKNVVTQFMMMMMMGGQDQGGGQSVPPGQPGGGGQLN